MPAHERKEAGGPQVNGHKFVKVTNLQLFFNGTSTALMKDALGNTPTLRDLFGSVTFLVRLM